MYRTDHIKVLKVLAGELPKRVALKTSDIVAKAFKRVENGDRRVRNAYRKLRKEGHVEIGDRGQYKLTQSGAAFCKKAAAENWKLAPPTKTKPTTKKKAAPKKAAPKKAAKAKKAPAKKKTTKKTAKKAAAKKAPKKKAPKKSKPSKGNGVPVETKKDSAASAQLNF